MRRELPRVEKDGVYGCGRCGTYSRFKAGDEPLCNKCHGRTQPMVYVRPLTPKEDQELARRR